VKDVLDLVRPQARPDAHAGREPAAVDRLVMERAERDHVGVHVVAALGAGDEMVAVKSTEGMPRERLKTRAAAPLGSDLGPARSWIAPTRRWLRVGDGGRTHTFFSSRLHSRCVKTICLSGRTCAPQLSLLVIFCLQIAHFMA
jgi:hypothetical protein